MHTTVSFDSMKPPTIAAILYGWPLAGAAWGSWTRQLIEMVTQSEMIPRTRRGQQMVPFAPLFLPPTCWEECRTLKSAKQELLLQSILPGLNVKASSNICSLHSMRAPSQQHVTLRFKWQSRWQEAPPAAKYCRSNIKALLPAILAKSHNYMQAVNTAALLTIFQF